MGVSGQKGKISLSQDPENDNHNAIRKIICKSLVQTTYSKTSIAVLQGTSLSIFEYLATALTAFSVSGCGWFTSHIKHPNSQKSQSPTDPFSSNLTSVNPVESGLFLPELTRNLATVFSAKSSFEFVKVPAFNPPKNGHRYTTATSPGC